MRPSRFVPAVAVIALLVAPAAAHAAQAIPGKVVVAFRSANLGVAQTGSDSSALHVRVMDVGPRAVQRTIARLRRRRDVAYAVPDYVVRAADFIPNDPGRGGHAGWQRVQWNFTGPWSVNAPAAWDTARRLGGSGGRGVIVAVIDSGVAYENYGRFRRSPDLYPGAFVAPYDFLKRDRHPDDQENHGTHVASTIAEKTNNDLGLTGLAYDARIMPLRVLDSNGDGDAVAIARAIRYAVAHGAQVINMSVEFDPSVRAADIPEVTSALDYATRHGVVLVAAAGNEGIARISYPARDPNAISVGATTADGCLAEYSNFGSGLTISAPGGGNDAGLSADPTDAANCHPGIPGRLIYQESFGSSPRRFGLVGFEGTSFAAPHVSAVAALLIASGRLGPRPSPAAVRQRLAATARDLGPAGYDPYYGAGLLDAAAALGP